MRGDDLAEGMFDEVRRFALNFAARSRFDADDAVGSALEELVRAARDYDHRPGGQFAPYAMQRVRWAIVDRERRYQHRHEGLIREPSLSLQAAVGNHETAQDLLTDYAANADDYLEAIDALERVARLEPRRRQIIVRQARGDTAREIAADLGVAESRISHLAADARRRLRAA